MTSLYLIRGPFDPERDLPAGTEAIEVDEEIQDAFRTFCLLVQAVRSLPDRPLDLERIWPEGRG